MPRITAIGSTSDSSIAQRQGQLHDWLMAASALADRSGDPEALTVSTFLKERAVLGLPRPNNDLAYVRRVGVIKKEAIYIVPMISRDDWILPPDDYWRAYASGVYLDGMGLAEYYPPTRAIYVPGERLAAGEQSALLLLHEGLHAYDHLVRRERMPKPFWRRERNAQLMELRVIRRLGGAPLVAYLDRLMPEVERQRHAGPKPFLLELPHSMVDNGLLDQVLWPANTRQARRFRTMDVERCAVAHYYERLYGKREFSKHYGQYVRDNYIAEAHPQHLANQ